MAYPLPAPTRSVLSSLSELASLAALSNAVDHKVAANPAYSDVMGWFDSLSPQQQAVCAAELRSMFANVRAGAATVLEASRLMGRWRQVASLTEANPPTVPQPGLSSQPSVASASHGLTGPSSQVTASAVRLAVPA